MIALQGILQSATPSTPLPPPYLLRMETSEAVSGSPVFQTSWDDVEFTKILTTTGTQVATGKLRVSVANDVTVLVTRTGDSVDVVEVNYYINGVPEGGTDTIAGGNPVSFSRTFPYLSIAPGDELKVVITEG
jgi:transglutaminase-like putative cysteine protease